MILMIDNERRRARHAPRIGRRFGGRKRRLSRRFNTDRIGMETHP
jgi:hypothetical protein